MQAAFPQFTWTRTRQLDAWYTDTWERVEEERNWDRPVIKACEIKVTAP
jgi:hypothetical protein